MLTLARNKPVPRKFLTHDVNKIESRIEELKNLLFYRMSYEKYDKLYYNYRSILDVYFILLEKRDADSFTKLVLEELLFL